jgi:hypothetical protein
MRAWFVAMLLAASAVLVGCGDDTSPAETEPALAERLDRVDAEIAADDLAGARKAVQALINETARARVDGSISAEQADAILRAAAELLRRLPRDGDAPEPPPSSPSPTEVPSDPESEEGDQDEDEDEGKDDKENKDEKGEGGGNGSSGENGPDDGHGN